LVGLRKILAPRRKRKQPRPGAPKTIVPPRDPFDAARERLKAQIPPPADD
jgi:hypothetical protein